MSRRTEWPCMFGSIYLRAEIDPRIQTEWRMTFGDPVPFGNIRRNWRSEHCRELNPYGSETCPYRESECATALLMAIRLTCWGAREPKGAMGYFRAVARSEALRRADEKPLARERHRETIATAALATQRPSDSIDRDRRHGTRLASDVSPQPESQDREAVAADESEYLRRRVSRPIKLGEMLGALDLGPHQGQPTDGNEGTER